MARSLSLGAWLALRRGSSGVSLPLPERPTLAPGERLIWLHCADAEGAQTVPALYEALASVGQRARIVVTLDDPGGTRDRDASQGPARLALPPDYRQPVRAFLDALRPDTLIWAGAPLRPVLLTETRGRGMLRLLINAAQEKLVLAEGGWIPGALGQLVAGFDHILTVDHLTAQWVERLGLAPARVEVTGMFDPLANPLRCNEHERRDLTETIGPRPVWHAASVPLAELDDVIDAHRHAARVMHRLLLIIAPAHSEEAEAMADVLRASDLRIALRADSEDPTEATEIYLAEGPGEAGLWYRLASITYLGGTLTSGAGDHPFEVAALGSAIVHGTHTAPHDAAFSRLTRAGASRMVQNGEALGHTIEALMAADRAATIAKAAWEVTTMGAVVANRIAGLIRDPLERRG